MREVLHQFRVRVFYEDTDMGGIVYHANYLKFIERARSDWVRALGVDQNALRNQGIVFAVRSLQAEWLTTARLDDELEVLTAPLAASGARVELSQEVRRGERPVFSARVTLAAIGPHGRPVRLPTALRQVPRPG